MCIINVCPFNLTPHYSRVFRPFQNRQDLVFVTVSISFQSRRNVFTAIVIKLNNAGSLYSQSQFEKLS